MGSFVAPASANRGAGSFVPRGESRPAAMGSFVGFPSPKAGQWVRLLRSNGSPGPHMPPIWQGWVRFAILAPSPLTFMTANLAGLGSFAPSSSGYPSLSRAAGQGQHDMHASMLAHMPGRTSASSHRHSPSPGTQVSHHPGPGRPLVTSTELPKIPAETMLHLRYCHIFAKKQIGSIFFKTSLLQQHACTSNSSTGDFRFLCRRSSRILFYSRN